MNRAEAMDLLQRQLDGDLTLEEQIVLEEHLRADSELHLLRQRLQRVSAELHHLPRVTPPFSLVDAILPKLEAVNGPASLENTEKIAQSQASESEKPTSLDSTQPLLSRKRLPIWLAKSAIGTVAACLLFGMFSAFGAWKTKERPHDTPEAGVPGKEQPFVVTPKTKEPKGNVADKDKKNKNKKKNENKNENKKPENIPEKKPENQVKKPETKGNQSRPQSSQKQQKQPHKNAPGKAKKDRDKAWLNDFRAFLKNHRNLDGKYEGNWGDLEDFINETMSEKRKKSEENWKGEKQEEEADHHDKERQKEQREKFKGKEKGKQNGNDEQ